MANPHPLPGPGRPKGSKNQFTKDLKTALLAPFNAKKFKEWADKNPTNYYTLIITKLLPKDVTVEGGLDVALFGDWNLDELINIATRGRDKGGAISKP